MRKNNINIKNMNEVEADYILKFRKM